MAFVLVFLLILSGLASEAQTSQKWYYTSAGEIIFSEAIIDYFGTEGGSKLRFSPVFNSQSHLNKDFGKYTGVFAGLNVRNVGFIMKSQTTNERSKYRTYNLGIPLGVKFGNLQKTFAYAGYELELPFHYKEKHFVGRNKVGKSSAWFSKKVPSHYNSLLLGLQFADGSNLKLKYYLTRFFNKSYKEETPAGPIRPYFDFDVNVFYISYSVDMLKAAKKAEDKVKDREGFLF